MDFEVIYQTKVITSTIQRLKNNLNKSLGSLLVEKKNHTSFISIDWRGKLLQQELAMSVL